MRYHVFFDSERHTPLTFLVPCALATERVELSGNMAYLTLLSTWKWEWAEVRLPDACQSASDVPFSNR